MHIYAPVFLHFIIGEKEEDCGVKERLPSQLLSSVFMVWSQHTQILRPLGWSAVPLEQPYLLPCQTTHASGEQKTCPRATAVMSEVYLYKGDSTLLRILCKDVPRWENEVAAEACSPAHGLPQLPLSLMNTSIFSEMRGWNSDIISVVAESDRCQCVLPP